jgi:hypothetical protein
VHLIILERRSGLQNGAHYLIRWPSELLRMLLAMNSHANERMALRRRNARYSADPDSARRVT